MNDDSPSTRPDGPTLFDFRVGQIMTSPPITVDFDHIYTFQGFLGHLDDSFSMKGSNLHIDEEFSQRHMYGGIVGDGHQTLQYIFQLLTDNLPPGALVSGYSTMDIKLTNPTRPGDTISVTATIRDVKVVQGRDYVVCDVVATKDGDVTIAAGIVEAYVPPTDTQLTTGDT